MVQPSVPWPVARQRLSMAALQANPWPRNVRQLQNVIFRAATMTGAAAIDVADLELAGATSASQAPAAASVIAQRLRRYGIAAR
jgi:transcriptional regulator of aromatic amino acid metabolism